MSLTEDSLWWIEQSRSTPTQPLFRALPMAPVDCSMCSFQNHGYSTETKCCTYLPFIANYEVPLFRKHLLQEWPPDTTYYQVMQLGLVPSTNYRQLFASTPYGTDPELLCPFYKDGLCSQWEHRPAECETFFCRPQIAPHHVTHGSEICLNSASHGSSNKTKNAIQSKNLKTYNAWSELRNTLTSIQLKCAQWVAIHCGASLVDIEGDLAYYNNSPNRQIPLQVTEIDLTSRYFDECREYYLANRSQFASLITK